MADQKALESRDQEEPQSVIVYLLLTSIWFLEFRTLLVEVWISITFIISVWNILVAYLGNDKIYE